VETVPLDDTFWDVVMAAKVVTIKTAAIRTKAIIDAVMDSCIFCVFYSSSEHIVSYDLINIINHLHKPTT
jgi:hypothetical protein